MSKTRYLFPFETLLSMGLIGGLMLGGAYVVTLTQKWENDGKPKRWNVDKWDRRMMERDSRLSGNVNIQVAEAIAPPQFARNSAQELEMDVLSPGPIVSLIGSLTKPILDTIQK